MTKQYEEGYNAYWQGVPYAPIGTVNPHGSWAMGWREAEETDVDRRIKLQLHQAIMVKPRHASQHRDYSA